MNWIKCYVNSISMKTFLLFLLYFKKKIFWQLASAGVYLFDFFSNGVPPRFCLSTLLDIRDGDVSVLIRATLMLMTKNTFVVSRLFIFFSPFVLYFTFIFCFVQVFRSVDHSSNKF